MNDSNMNEDLLTFSSEQKKSEDRNLIQIITQEELFNTDDLRNYLRPLLYGEDGKDSNDKVGNEYDNENESVSEKKNDSNDEHRTDKHRQGTDIYQRPPLHRMNSKRDTLQYHTISIFGPQSSGKSTLLNHLFQTNFDIMQSEQYSQCTLGIFLSIADIMNQKVFVLDVEGTDSPERQQHGDEGQSFEKRVSLFALAVSEVLLVNLWAKDVNRYQASNYSLLKTVFEMNLQLFYQESAQSKTMLLFILRDYDGFIGKDKMSMQVQNHVEKIWESCSKPKGKENVKVIDLFDVRIEFLPHKVYEPENFKSAINDMKSRIFDPSSDEYIFQEKYHKKVPLAGFDVYTENIWKQIMENKDLNIPAQKEILARFRCAEISEEIMHEFVFKQNEWTKESKSKLIEKFGKVSKNFVDDLINQFEEQASLYVPSVVEETSNELRKRMKTSLYSIFLNLATLSRRSHEEKFREELRSLVDKSPNNLLTNFYSVARDLEKKSINSFKNGISDLTYPDSDWDAQNVTDDLSANISQIISDAREKQLKLQLQKQKEVIATMIDQVLQSNKKSGLLYAPKETFWAQFRDAMKEILDENRDTYELIHKEYSCSPQEKLNFKNEIENHMEQHAKKAIAEYVKFIPSQMMKIFSSNFPPADMRSTSIHQLMEYFSFAREEALSHLNIFYLYRDDPEYDNTHLIFSDFEEGKASRYQFEYSKASPPEKLLISENDVKGYFMEFSHDIEIKLVNAKHELQRARMTSIPWWIYIALLVLGWNEIMYVLRNPLILLIVFACGVIYLWLKFKDGADQFLNSIENPTIKLALRMVSDLLPASLIPPKEDVSAEKKEK